MNIKKLLIGNFFLTFIWFLQSYLLPLHRQTIRTTQKKIGFPTLVAAYTYQNLRGLLTVGAKRQTKKQIKNP